MTVAPATKLLPLIVSVKSGLPAVKFVGEMLVVVGGRLLTVSMTALDVPPPGVGLKTVIG